MVGGVVVGLRWPVMTLDGLVAEAGEALGRARSFGPAAFGVGFASTPALQGAGARVASGVGESHGVWQGGAGSGYRRDANWTVQALDTTIGADAGTGGGVVQGVALRLMQLDRAGRARLTRVGRPLCREHPKSIASWVAYYADPDTAAIYAHLDAQLRDGAQSSG